MMAQIEFGSDEAKKVRELDKRREWRDQARQEYPQEYVKVLQRKWYTAGPPWFPDGEEEGAIQASSDDPHIAQRVADCSSFFLEDEERGVFESPLELAAHIVKLHNEWLAGGPDIICHLRSAIIDAGISQDRWPEMMGEPAVVLDVAIEHFRDLVNDATCTWRYDDDDYYETACNQAFVLEAGNLQDNSFIYCPFCGRRISEPSRPGHNDAAGSMAKVIRQGIELDKE